MRKININSYIIVGIISILSFGLGACMFHTQTPEGPQTEIAQIIAAAPPGSTIEIVETGEDITDQGETIFAKDSFKGWRQMSWFGLSPLEVSAKRQGLDVDDYGVFGQSKGYGILEQLWVRIKSIFWFLIFAGVVLVILSFVPATAPFTRGLLRMIASIFPFIGSVVERITAGIKLKKKDDETKDIVTSVQKGREKLANVNPDAAVTFDETVEKNMNTETKNKVKEIKALQ